MLANCTRPDGTVRKNENCKCDIGIGSWWETSNRTTVAFLPPHGHVGCGVVVHVDNITGKQNIWFFFQTFTVSVWAGIAALIVAITILKVMDGRFAPVGKPLKVPSDRRFRCPAWTRVIFDGVTYTRLKRAFQDTGIFLPLLTIRVLLSLL